MPAVSTQNSPRETYPFRPSNGVQFGMPASDHLSMMSNNNPSISSFSFRDPAFRDAAMRDVPLTPGPRGSVGGSATIVGSRGSLSSLASLGTLSTRASMGSVGSMSSSESTNTLVNSESSTMGGMWHGNGDDTPNSSIISNGGLPTAPSSATSLTAPKLPLSAPGANNGNTMMPSSSSTSLHVSALPRDLTLRECHFLFALAPDFVSVEMNRNAVSGEVSVLAKFSTLHGAQSAAQAFERRNDLFGYEIKTNIQSFALPFGAPSQAQQPRNLYTSRPLFAESYWSQSPLSPSTTSDIFSNSRRPSLISPTDHPNTQMGHVSLPPSSPSSQHYENPSFNNGTDMNSNKGNTGNGSVNNKSSISSNSTGSSNSNANGSAFFAQPAPRADSSSPSSKVVSPSSSSPLSGSAPISSASATNSSGPIGSTVSVQQDGNSNQGQFNYPHQGQQPGNQSSTHIEATKIPPPNPADQNPPCNTLYVGNLPPDTSENELKELFSQQPGYRRLCFRTKQNGPMCFVEFEDEKMAGKALSELYGVALSNSVKGGIRLSYSKNPLGVRSRPIRSK